MSPSAHVVHALPGRVRIKIPSKQGDMRYFSRLYEKLTSYPGMTAMHTNYMTESLLVEHPAMKLMQLQQYAKKRQLFSLDDLEYRSKAVWEKASLGLEAIDSKLTGITKGDVDFRSVVFLVLLVLAVRQLFRGQILAPAATLFWYALELLIIPKSGKDI